MAEKDEVTTMTAENTTSQLGWIDNWINKIDNLRVPTWLFYSLAMLTVTLVLLLGLWLDGTVPFGTYEMLPGIFPPLLLLFLAFYHYLTKVSSQSLHNFSPLFNGSDIELTRIEENFLVLPRWISRLIMVISIPMAFPFVWGGPSTWGNILPNTQLPFIVLFLLIVPFNYTFFCLCVRSFRQIRMISELHSQATDIDLMKLEPAHAFSKLTATTGIGLFLSQFFGLLYNPDSINSNWNTFGYVGIGFVSLLIFVIPIIGMRGKLRGKKTDELHRMEDLIRTTNLSLHQKVELSDFDDLGGIQSALNMLTHERDEIKSISTWPWNTGTIRGFTSTLILPIFLRYMYQLLENFF